MKYDFSGYATKANVKCTDGRIIKPNAFRDSDGETVPLVWHHRYDDPTNILGHVRLEDREDGVYAYGKFNDTDAGKNAKELVKHGDIKALSIHANKLVQKGSDVIHGYIREVSLVLSGANSGAFIDNISLAHSDGTYHELDDEAIMSSGEEIELPEEEVIEHTEDDIEDEDIETILSTLTPKQEDAVYMLVHYAQTGEDISHADDEETVADIFETLNDKQKEVVYALVSMASEEKETKEKETKEKETKEKETEEKETEEKKEKDSETSTKDEVENKPIKHEGDDIMKVNVFDQQPGDKSATLTHNDIQEIFKNAKTLGSLKEAFLVHADEQGYGVEDIELLFPEARNVTPTPEMISREMAWVEDVLKGTRKTPFSRIKSTAIDITADEARARGYVKGNLKKDEIVKALRRTTGPTTVYKKQKLDRDDILDITDFDIVMWLKMEMRLMLNEEIARAVLIGDGRDIESEDKIQETSIRPIAYDNELYSHKVIIPAGVTGNNLIEAVLRARKHYKGKGRPKFYTTESILIDLLLLKDKIGRRLYNSEAELAQALRVTEIVAVEPMEEVPSVLGIMVNMSDYTIGTNKGGEVSLFDDFDIDYNQYKYLIETRMSGALTSPKTALVFLRDQGIEVQPFSPTFDAATGILTVPSKAGVVYKLAGVLEDTILEAGEQEPIERGETIEVIAVPEDGYHFPHNTIAVWEFIREL